MNADKNTQLAFRANAGIKDIIGRGLILDDNIAIIELIKNSKDASSPKVKLHFKDSTNSSQSELILKDFGDGMSINDISDKWLNIAYSEKKEVNSSRKKPLAGSKGVGRFSCDRLGKGLILYTKSVQGDYIKLPINWKLFETNSIDAEISTIKLEHEILSKEKFLSEIGEASFKKGTILKITDLRTIWNEKKIQKLTSELEKFISNPDQEFKVSLKINNNPEKTITNSIFEDLSFRTYHITSNIDAEGKTLTTELRYHGETIYSYKVDNPYKHLKNIKIDIHYLNFSSKLYFKKRTSYATNDYGSIFMFLNGFRISPFGNPKNDWLGLDQRKTQGTARYLGTRDVIGKVSVLDTEDLFKPITSREGMVQDEPYQELTAFDKEQRIELRNGQLDYGYVTHITRQLERFIVEGLNWHNVIDLTQPDRKNISEKDIKADPSNFAFKTINETILKETINKTLRTSNFGIKSFDINTKLVVRLAQEADDAYNEFVLSFIENTTDKSLEELNPSDKGNFKKIALRNMESIKAEKKALIEAHKQQLRAEEAELKLERERIRAKEAEKREAEAKSREMSAKTAQSTAEANVAIHQKSFEVEKKRRLFAEASQKPDSKKNEELIHHIRLLGDIISGELKETLQILQSASPEERLQNQGIQNRIQFALFNNDKLLKFARIVANADFDMMSDTLTTDIFSFVQQYLDDIKINGGSVGLSINFYNQNAHELPLSFSPIEVSMLIDNIIENASNGEAKQMNVSVSEANGFLDLIFKNNGNKLTDRFSGDELFKAGITTTTGSGIGLSQVHRIAIDLDAKVCIFDNLNKGISVRIRWEK